MAAEAPAYLHFCMSKMPAVVAVVEVVVVVVGVGVGVDSPATTGGLFFTGLSAYLQVYSKVVQALHGYSASHFRLRWWHGMHAFLARLRLAIAVDMDLKSG